ncbi:lipoyl protein ligase domain-containing protein [Azohydromonas caseinilytica]|uniref:Lipoate--protein ligase family protein n=1 Tax=Azohydromonas caseinilytica TaxID=2728836 RepID=A0A848FB59_9BURK|nr:lipoate--protein ligase family protein [Azohydromonas caseinilytica]NML16562.1 lipoate--protein ligase family protein [Azohydromonas caseinilytica]
MWAAEEQRPAAAAPVPPRFVLLPAGDRPQDGLALEQLLLERAAGGGAFAAIWECRPALVVPATYRRFERFELLCERSALQGWPVSVRRSGGGLVPQGPGMVNLSLAWRTRCRMAEAMEPVYRGLCGLLQEAFEAFGLEALAQPVEGSFCDGRFNLALDGRKVVGTAQYWKRANAEEHVVLAHACVLVDADLPLLVGRANAFEAQLGSDKQYRVEAVANLVSGLDRVPVDGPRPGLTAASFAQRLAQVVDGSAALC